MQWKSVWLAGLSAAGVLLISAFPAYGAPWRDRGAITPQHLRCEYRENPSGLEEMHPRLSWICEATRDAKRGEGQTAFQILVAKSTAALDAGQGELWDSGKVAGDRTLEIIYAGRPLVAGEPCVWKTRIWDREGRPSPWSKSASWSMGLLNPSDWHAQWISAPVLADSANRPRTPIHCYRSALASNPDTTKWILLDLGALQRIDGINLMPARPQGLNPDIGTILFPKRFRVEAAEQSDLHDARTVVDQTGQDLQAPRSRDLAFHFASMTARYVRLTVTRLGYWDAQDYGIALGQFEVYEGKTNVAIGARVSCSDSTETEQWSARYLTDGKADVAIAPFPAAVALDMPGASPSRVPMLRREFSLPASVRRAILTITARGFYEARINGRRVGDELLAPGYTEYDHRISYQTLDVTALLHKGHNAIGALLGYGWYAGHMNLADNRYLYGYFPQLLARLDVEMADGKHVLVGTDARWRTSLQGPVRWSDLLDGECIDYRLNQSGWDKAGFQDAHWKPAWSQPRNAVALGWQRSPPVKVMHVIRPVAVKQVRPGVFVYDMGAEITGWCRMEADGPAGTHIVLRHAEAVTPAGEVDETNLWGVAQQEDYILDGKGPHVLEPHFTYHGFRYVELSGLHGAPRPDTLLGINIYTDAATVGRFACSNPLYNQIMDASRRTQTNLLFDVPAGCAARSERVSWTGDVRPCVQTALFHLDTAAFFEKYLSDLRDSQTPDGRFTDICPHAHLRDTEICVGSPGWADAGVSLPWDLYVNTGDRTALAKHYHAARRWVDFIHRNNPDLLWRNRRGQDWGDWLSAGPATPRDIGSTAFFAHDADLVARMAGVLGYPADAARYHGLFEGIKAAFARKFVSADGVIGDNAQGSYALALQFDLLDEPLRSRSVERLVEAIRRNDGHPTTGFWSSIELVLALSANGKNQEAAQIVNLRTAPSWGYMMASGGTTFWEAYDADKKGLSLNHWTHSASGEWLWSNVAGIHPDPAHPGYRSFLIRPRPSPEVTWCKADYDSVRGRIALDWRNDPDDFRLALRAPANTTATVYLPVIGSSAVTVDGVPASRAEGVRFVRREQNALVYVVQSGSYKFQTGRHSSAFRSQRTSGRNSSYREVSAAAANTCASAHSAIGALRRRKKIFFEDDRYSIAQSRDWAIESNCIRASRF